MPAAVVAAVAGTAAEEEVVVDMAVVVAEEEVIRVAVAAAVVVVILVAAEETRVVAGDVLVVAVEIPAEEVVAFIVLPAEVAMEPRPVCERHQGPAQPEEFARQAVRGRLHSVRRTRVGSFKERAIRVRVVPSEREAARELLDRVPTWEREINSTAGTMVITKPSIISITLTTIPTSLITPSITATGTAIMPVVEVIKDMVGTVALADTAVLVQG